MPSSEHKDDAKMMSHSDSDEDQFPETDIFTLIHDEVSTKMASGVKSSRDSIFKQMDSLDHELSLYKSKINKQTEKLEKLVQEDKDSGK